MRNLYKALLLFIIFLIQPPLSDFIRILGIAPNLLLCAAIAAALTAPGPCEAALFGLGAGALYDIMWGRVFGVNALFMMYICIAVFYTAAYIYRKTVISCVVITFCGALLFELVFYAVSFFIWGSHNIQYFILRVIIPAAAYTAFFQLIIYPITPKVKEKNPRRIISNEV
jgi:rod shape-determining protein MreD